MGQVAPTVLAAQEAQEGPNTPGGRLDQAGPVDRTVPAAQEAMMGPAGPVARVDPDGRVTEAPVARVDRTTMAGIGARHPRTCLGAAWTRAGSTTSRSTTTAAG